MRLAPILVPFREALIVGVRGGQLLRSPLSTLQRVRSGEFATSGAFPRYRYANRVTGEVLETACLDLLVDRWMRDLDFATQMDVSCRRALEEAVQAVEQAQREGGVDDSE
jgi:hypothetical protein